MTEPRYRLLAETAMHLNGGFSQLRMLTLGGSPLELPTERIPHRFRPLGSTFVVAFSFYKPRPTDSIDDIRQKISDTPYEFFEPTEDDVRLLGNPYTKREQQR
jgi:hypothetical protein